MKNKEYIKEIFLNTISQIEKEYSMESGELGRFTPELLDKIEELF